MSGAVRARLADGRLHLQHGPIDLIIEAWGAAGEVQAACDQATRRFDTVLEELVAELPLLRTPVTDAGPVVKGAIARRMLAAVRPHRAVFITPMAAVAGAVADEIIASLLRGRRIAKAYVNNGGDIAVHVAAGESLGAGIVSDPLRPALSASARLDAPCGIATSGWRGRSHSLGIADAVTAIAASAAVADAAATRIANAVNAEHPAIRRRRACDLKEDSDLGERPVTVAVGPLPPEIVDAALDCGLALAGRLRRRGGITDACLTLQGRIRALPPRLNRIEATA